MSDLSFTPLTIQDLEFLKSEEYGKTTYLSGFGFTLLESRGGGIQIIVKKPHYHSRLYMRDFFPNEEMLSEINLFMESVLNELDGLKNV